MMSSYNRIGAVWAGGSRSLLTDVLRGEWGCKGAVITDNSALNNHWMDGPDSVLAGADLFFQPNFSQPINFVGAVAIQAVAES